MPLGVGAIYVLLATLMASCSNSTSPEGTWLGTAELGGSKLEFSIALERGDSGRWSGTLSSQDLLMLRSPLRNLRVDSNNVSFELPDPDAPLTFTAIFQGTTGQGHGGPVPEAIAAHLRRRGADPALRLRFRRSEPVTDSSIRSEPVSIPRGGVTLRGEVFAPAATGRHAAVLLLQGSTSNERHHYYAYADYFARQGFAALVFDKRGSGDSTGDYASATYLDLKDDAAAALRVLRQRYDVDAACVGVWGLSQGGMIGAMVAAEAKVSFFVAVSAPGVTLGESAAYQDRLRVLRRGFSAAEADTAAELHHAISEWSRTGVRGNLDERLRNSAGAPWRRATALPRELPSDSARKGWYWGSRALDPLSWWSKISVPVLLLYGEADDLVPARESAERITQALRDSGNRDVTLRTYDGADHLIRLAPTSARLADSGFEWPRAVPEYLPGVAGWMRQTCAGQRSVAGPAQARRVYWP
jgi:pimeloyl-ACP methyl ester carboxylesterase